MTKLTIDQAWELIEELNERAHQEAWDLWIAADETEDDNEEELREEASDAQREYFWDELADLPQDQYNAIFEYARIDEGFRDQFEAFNGPLDEEE